MNVVLHYTQVSLNNLRERVRAAEHAPRGPFCFLERRRGLADIVERGSGDFAARHRAHPPHPEREFVTLSENASRHGYRFSKKCFGFFEAPHTIKGRRVVVGCYESLSMFLSTEPQTSGIYILLHT